MLKIPVEKDEKIEKALKRFKRKISNTKMITELRERQHFLKSSDKKRQQKKKAIYIQKLKDKEERAY